MTLEAIKWYFFDVPQEIIRGGRNFFVFNFHYFSTLLLLKTFFSPWHKYSYSYGRIFEWKKNIQVFIFNSMSRLIGAFLRFVLIILSILSGIFIFLISFFIFIFWFLLPFLLLITFFLGLVLIIW